MREEYFSQLEMALDEMQLLAMDSFSEEFVKGRIKFWSEALYLVSHKTIHVRVIETYLRRVAEATEIERFGRPWNDNLSGNR